MTPLGEAAAAVAAARAIARKGKSSAPRLDRYSTSPRPGPSRCSRGGRLNGLQRNGYQLPAAIVWEGGKVTARKDTRKPAHYRTKTTPYLVPVVFNMNSKKLLT